VLHIIADDRNGIGDYLAHAMRRMLLTYGSRRAMFLYSKLGGTLSVTLIVVFIVGLLFLRLEQHIEQLGEA